MIGEEGATPLVGRDTEARISRPRRTAFHGRRTRTGLLMSLPAVVLVGGMLGIPICQAIYYSMTRWDGITATWIGPSLYLDEFRDSVFWRVVENNGLLLIAVPVVILIGMGIALLLNAHAPGWRIFRTLYFLPTSISWVVIGMIALRVFAADGKLNDLLAALGFGFIHTDLLSGERTALLAVGITFIWSMIGTNMIIFLAGLATLDPVLAEAGRVDGATNWQIFSRITFPQLRRFVQFAFVITTISAFTALFSLIFVMTGGGPGYGTTTLEFFVYQSAFSKAQFGLAAMLGMILFFIMAIIGAVQMRLLRTSD